MRAALYLRVSTTDQTTANQERELRAAAKRIGHTIVAVYADNGISGSNRRPWQCDVIRFVPADLLDTRPDYDSAGAAELRRQLDAAIASCTPSSPR